jgi:hypothetical protein
LQTHHLIAALCLVVASAAGSLATAADDIPTPSVDRIDYSHPEKYLEVHPSFGDVEKIREICKSLKAASAEKTLAAIDRWMNNNLKYDPKAGYVARNFDAIVNSKVFGGCAEHSIVFAALARACGIPTVTVKTLDADWIREFVKTGATAQWNGHVFLEVFFDRRWHLLNATQMELHDDYDPAMRILPGNRYAYDKGSDPFQLPLSADWERWKIQTRRYFTNFDVKKLPVGPGRQVGSEDDVYIAADSPVYQAISQRISSLGYRPRTTFNTQYETILPKTKGKILVETCAGKRAVPPVEAYAAYVPLTREEINKRIADGGSGIARKRLTDGTRVVLIYARDVPKLLEVIRTMELWPGS